MPRADDLFARLGLDPQDPAVRHALLELAFGPGGIARAGTPSRPDPRIEVAPPPRTPLLLTVKVALDEAKPPIWRRLSLRGDLTLEQTHDYLQAAMGWTDSHLHHFEPGPRKQRWTGKHFVTAFDLEEGEEGTPEADVRLDQVLRTTGDRLFYTYDFGDDWAHTITVETIRPATDEDPDALCHKAVRACPPEDVGGIRTWNELAALLRANPDPRALTGEHRMYADWLAPDVDPEAVEVDDINLALALVGADPATLVASLGTDGDDPFAGMHPAYVAVVDKAPPDLVVDLAALMAAAMVEVDPPSEADLAALLRPWVVLLDQAQPDGIRLTKAGWMEPQACRRLWTEGGLDWGFGQGNREQHTPEITVVRRAAVEAGLLRTRNGRLLLTKKGQAAAGDIRALAAAMAAGLLHVRGDAAADERVLTLQLLAAEVEPEPRGEPGWGYGAREAFLDEVAYLLTRLGWRIELGPIRRDHLGEARDVLTVLTLADRGDRGDGGDGGDGAPGISFVRMPSAAARHLARLALLPTLP